MLTYFYMANHIKSFDDKYFNDESLKSDLKKRAVSSAGAVIFGRAATYFINLFNVIILARLITPDDFGLVAMVTAPFMILIDVGNLGLGEATIQREYINHKQISALFWIIVSLSLTLTFVLIIISPLVASFYGDKRLESITFAIASLFILGGLSTIHLSLLRRKMQFYRISAIGIIAAITSVFISISLAFNGWGYWAVVSRYASLSVTTVILSWLLCNWRPAFPSFDVGVIPMVKFGINNLIANFIYYFTKNVDKVLIGWRYGGQALGNYERAYHIFVVPLNQLSFPLAHVALSSLSRLSHIPEKFHHYYLNSISILAFVGMLLSTIVTLNGNDIVFLLLGPQWGKAGQILSVFGLSIGMSLIYMTYGWLNLSLGRADKQLKLNIASFLVTALLIIIGLPFGSLGVAIAYTVSFYLLTGPCLWYAGSPIKLRISQIISAVWKYFAAAFTAGVLTWYILYSINFTSCIFSELNILLRIFVSCTFSTAIYLLMVIALYQSLDPLFKFLSLLHDMIPKKGQNTTTP